MIRLLIYSLICVIAGAGSGLAQTQAVVIDHLYDAELVKLACLPKMEASCVDKKVHDLTAFEDSIRAHLTSDQGCGEVSVVSNGEPPTLIGTCSSITIQGRSG